MRRVVVSQRIDINLDRGERRDALDQRLVSWIARAGYNPIPIPNCLSREDLQDWLEEVQPTALVLSGGNDIGECLDRDFTERALLTHAESCEIPVLGICRGMQMMGVWAGVRLLRVSGHAGTRHLLDDIAATEVNSYHKFSLAECPNTYNVLARATDGEIEAIRHQRLAWEGWMWHPERESDSSPLDLARVRALFRTL